MPENQNAEGQTGTWTDPYTSYHFAVDINGDIQGRFVECSPIEVDVEAIKYREAGRSQHVHVLPGRVEYADVTLRYGMTKSGQLWDWMQKSVNGTVERQNISIVMFGHDGNTEVLRWNLIDCWPRRWRGAALDAMSNEVAVESLVLVFERLERVVAGEAAAG